ncbi:sulfotransferase 1C4 isoform X2 [Agrilus planipennis]|uniref:Sulfotransferase 1C4 isoform X2 n=1 Tax=Agrilus planipennis TaxID=224129 RepID=A0A7F5RMF6_AGRPL|nr:sulfotransferase 1C4 isoform X2 [Agrilus planipennis]XP_025837214.1 sulfotransferase 1C4 isoform X2 [Agrilus planipennis]
MLFSLNTFLIIHNWKHYLTIVSGEKTGFVQVGPQKWLFPNRYQEEANELYNFEVTPDDVWIVTFPRSGTTWTQEMVWLLSNNFDYEKAKTIPLIERFPFLEFSICVHPDIKERFRQENSKCLNKLKKVEELDKPGWKIFENYSGRRFIKTHLPFSLLPPDLLRTGCKVIYVARNPKDVAVSYYHLNRLFITQGFNGNFETFWNYFENNLVHWAPYWSHIQEGWDRRNEENCLFMFYEDMCKNQQDTILKVAEFLGIDVSEKQLNKLDDHLKIENFRKNDSVNFEVLREIGVLNSKEQGFIRNGKNSKNSTYYTPELEERVNLWIEKNLIKTDLRFPKILK